MSAGQGRGRFRYGLQPLLDLRQWQLDTLKAEAIAARQVLADRERELATVEADMAGCHERLARARMQGTVMDLAHEMVMRQYLAGLSSRMDACRAARDEALRVRDTVLRNVRRAQQMRDGMTRHEARQKKAHAAAQVTAQAREADEAWLLAHGRGEPA